MLLCRRGKEHLTAFIVPVGELLLTGMCFLVYGAARLFTVTDIPYPILLYLGFLFFGLAVLSARWIRGNNNTIQVSSLFSSKQLPRQSTSLELEKAIRNYSVILKTGQSSNATRTRIMNYPFGSLAIKDIKQLAEIFTLKFEL